MNTVKTEKTEIYARVATHDIDFLSKIIEGYDNLGILSTLDPARGEVIIRVTEDTFPEMMDILHHLPFPIEIEPEDTCFD